MMLGDVYQPVTELFFRWCVFGRGLFGVQGVVFVCVLVLRVPPTDSCFPTSACGGLTCVCCCTGAVWCPGCRHGV